MKAGRWVFATGLMAQDFANGIAPDVLAERLPHAGPPKREKEAARIFGNLDAVLRAAGTDARQPRAHRPVLFDGEGRAALPGGAARVPAPAESRHQPRLRSAACCCRSADMNIQAVAVMPSAGFEPQHLRHADLQGRATSGYPAALTVGDFIFVPGVTALATGDEPSRNGVAEAALMTQGAQWGGQPVKLEAEFLITQPPRALARAGRRHACRRGARAGLSDASREECSAFNEVWQRHFGPSGTGALDHPLHRARARPARRHDRDQHARREVRRRDPQAADRHRDRDRRSAASRRR